LLIPNVGAMNGKAAISSTLMDMLKDPNLTLSFAPTKVEVAKSGDVGYTEGTYSLTMTDSKTKKVVTEKAAT
jgi:ketosteroid isomerase-like protein